MWYRNTKTIQRIKKRTFNNSRCEFIKGKNRMWYDATSNTYKQSRHLNNKIYKKSSNRKYRRRFPNEKISKGNFHKRNYEYDYMLY